MRNEAVRETYQNLLLLYSDACSIYIHVPIYKEKCSWFIRCLCPHPCRALQPPHFPEHSVPGAPSYQWKKPFLHFDVFYIYIRTSKDTLNKGWQTILDSFEASLMQACPKSLKIHFLRFQKDQKNLNISLFVKKYTLLSQNDAKSGWLKT